MSNQEAATSTPHWTTSGFMRWLFVTVFIVGLISIMLLIGRVHHATDIYDQQWSVGRLVLTVILTIVAGLHVYRSNLLYIKYLIASSKN